MTERRKRGTETPRSSSEAATKRMKAVRSRDTAPEKALRSALHRLGLRFRVNQPVVGVRRKADVVFRKARVAVFIDGCFWHGCPLHASWPKANAEFWRTKIEANRTRDVKTDRDLIAAGWTPIRVWEHECVEAAATRVGAIVRAIESSSYMR
ncbi:very short patch repair endonuclease [Corallococcus exercitus]|uniref:Very short patch repair endonuclease n=1 Tax=Corallococcus exercitus TaxID=2316736 RepID=A0A7Y4KEB0_9BACT|nr:very short patch repair endonuclease [Corallococcus exercitus]NOK32263.1 very short patch repair endonuclease [Corallococcus exercitus]